MPLIDCKSTLFIDGTKALREILAVLQIQLDRLVYAYLAHMFLNCSFLLLWHRVCWWTFTRVILTTPLFICEFVQLLDRNSAACITILFDHCWLNVLKGKLIYITTGITLLYAVLLIRLQMEWMESCCQCCQWFFNVNNDITGCQWFCNVNNGKTGCQWFCNVNNCITGWQWFCNINNCITGCRWFCNVNNGKTGCQWFCNVNNGISGCQWFCNVNYGITGCQWFCNVNYGITGCQWFCNVNNGITGCQWFCNVNNGITGCKWFCNVYTGITGCQCSVTSTMV